MDSEGTPHTPSQSYFYDKRLWNALIVVLLLFVGLLAFAYFSQNKSTEAAGVSSTPAGKPVQIDVLNGCGVSRIASKFTVYLRRQGFDVVEMRNYKSFDMRETLVIDRVGNLSHAHRVAEALGVSKKNVIQEINPDYFVDVSVVIGKDYPRLIFIK